MTLQKKSVLIISSDKTIQDQLLATTLTLNCTKYNVLSSPDEAMKEIARENYDLILCELEFEDGKNDIFDVFSALIKQDQLPSVLIYSDEVDEYRDEMISLLNHFSVKSLKSIPENNSKAVYFIASVIKELLKIDECKNLETIVIPELQKKVSRLENSLSIEVQSFMVEFIKNNRKTLMVTASKVLLGLVSLAGIAYGVAKEYLSQ